jgi:hypothetical protein
VRDEKWVPANIHDLNVGQIRSIAFRSYPVDEYGIGLLVQEQVALHFVTLEPLRQGSPSFGQFLVNLYAQLNVAEFPVMLQPLPELRHSLDGVEVTVCVDQHIRVEQIEHRQYPYAACSVSGVALESNAPTFWGFTARTFAALTVERAPLPSIRRTNSSRASPMRCRRTT